MPSALLLAHIMVMVDSTAARVLAAPECTTTAAAFTAAFMAVHVPTPDLSTIIMGITVPIGGAADVTSGLVSLAES